MSNCVYNFNFHLVWVTKYRKKIFNSNEKQTNMSSILQVIADENQIIIQSMEVVDDHIHMLISFPPSLRPASVIQRLKGKSSYDWFRKYPDTKNILWGGHLWSPSYYISTLGDISKKTVEKYISNQEAGSGRDGNSPPH